MRVSVESPYNAPGEAGVRLRIKYARACVRDSLMRGEAPFASHLLYTQTGILNDRSAHERDAGLRAAHTVLGAMDMVAVYVDLGISDGMRRAMQRAKEDGVPVTLRLLHDFEAVIAAEPSAHEGW